MKTRTRSRPSFLGHGTTERKRRGGRRQDEGRVRQRGSSTVRQLAVEDVQSSKITATTASRNWRQRNVRKFVRHPPRHQLYPNTLLSGGATKADFRQFSTKRHLVRTVTVIKVCPSAFNNERHILNDGIPTIACEHKHIRRNYFHCRCHCKYLSFSFIATYAV